MSHRYYFSLLLFFCAFARVGAQTLQSQGKSVEDLVPLGWTHTEAEGDLDKDGIADLVLMAIPDSADKMFTRDDGYVYNFNRPILAIYFRSSDGLLKLWKQYSEVLPADENDICSYIVHLNITEQNTLVISTELSCSMGSWFATQYRFTYGFQNVDFHLIGLETEEIQRNTGDCKLVSDNFLTWKRQVKTWNFSEDTAPKVKWVRLKKKPLEKLGDRHLGVE